MKKLLVIFVVLGLIGFATACANAEGGQCAAGSSQTDTAVAPSAPDTSVAPVTSVAPAAPAAPTTPDASVSPAAADTAAQPDINK